MEFDELQIYVTPATPYLVDIIPTRCVSDGVGDGVSYGE